ncbi:membrane protein insertase YidC [Candidatus Peregrinibacteria bacterium]|nr:membrane protein insertase YidC [Candidatus Peregrinibacteria bacterium]
MEKLNKILKNVLIFLVVFLAINYLMSSCQDKEEDLIISSGNVLFTTTDNEYSRSQTVTLKIKNGTEQEIFIPNECPNEPFDVYRYENNKWIQKTATPQLNCENAKDVTLAPNEEIKIRYENWNHALFSEMGRFKIEFTGKIRGEEKTLTSNEFIIVKEGILKQTWYGIFYRPIYNALIFLTYIMPKHDLGLAIILLTIIIRTILLIPSQKSMKSQKRLQEIQPRLEKIKEKYKGDQQKIATETMAVWKEAKVNPMGSCLPILLQFPFLIAIFYAIKGGLNPDNAYLFYTEYANFSLADINVKFMGLLDLTKTNIYVLPLIVGGLQFVQMKLTMSRNLQKKKKKEKDKGKEKKKNEMAMATNTMTYIMPVMIAVFTASLPAGIGIYWGTSTIYGIVQQIIVNREGETKNKDEPTVKVINTKK